MQSIFLALHPTKKSTSGHLILLALVSLGASTGILGALFGLGGGVIFVPVLMLAFGMAPAEAAAVSLVGIVAGSVEASSVFVEKGLANVRLGLLLEVIPPSVPLLVLSSPGS